MSQPPAIDLSLGQFQVNQNGSAQYNIKIEIPPGIGVDNEPSLALQYTQSAPNGPLGVGWSLGGLSSIQRCSPSIATDGANQLVPYDPTQSRLALDGLELLNTSSAPYGDPMAAYELELNPTCKTVTAQGSGFLVRDNSGRSYEYGTTPDSLNLGSDSKGLEWHLKRSIDIHGNFVTYNYISAPATIRNSTSTTASDLGMRYIDNICYTSNGQFQGCRYVYFSYTTRPDAVVQTRVGGYSVCVSLLSDVYVSFKSAQGRTDIRHYSLSYKPSSTTKASCLANVTLSSCGPEATSLAPTTFTYSDSDISTSSLFAVDGTAYTTFSDPVGDVINLIPMDFSGRGFTDIVCVLYHKVLQILYLKTYIATPKAISIGDEIECTWSPASTPVELIEYTSDTAPKFLFADVQGNGRTGLILPYSYQNCVAFSISQCNDTTFKPTTVYTNAPWVKNAEFVAIDVNGNGRTDIVQVYPRLGDGKLAFQAFLADGNGGYVQDSGPSVFGNYDFKGTMDLLVTSSLSNNARYLVWVWYQQDGTTYNLSFTTFVYNGANQNMPGITELSTIRIANFTSDEWKNVTVLPVDANGDGIQDLIVCQEKLQINNSGADLSLMFTTYLSDGLGSFEKYGKSVNIIPPMSPGQAPKSKGQLQAISLFGSSYIDLAYIYVEQETDNLMCVAIQGSCSGVPTVVERFMIAGQNSLPLGSVSVGTVDINGTSKGGLIAYAAQIGGGYAMVPIYNKSKVPDLLTGVSDPMGLETTIDYGVLSDPTVYTTSYDWRTYTKKSTDTSYPVFGGGIHVVSQVSEVNNPAINFCTYQKHTRKQYANQSIALSGRGSQGYASVITDNLTDHLRTVEQYETRPWPLAGLMVQLETHQLDQNNPLSNPAPIRSQIDKHRSQTRKSGNWTIYHNNHVESKIQMYDNGVLSRYYGISYVYDDIGNLIEESPWDTDPNNNQQKNQTLWTRYEYTSTTKLQGLLSAKKVSSVGTDQDMTRFEPHDLQFIQHSYDQTSGLLQTTSEWSDELAKAAITSISFDQFGNKTSTTTPSGLTTTTQIDTICNLLPVKVTKNGGNVNLTETSAYNVTTASLVGTRNITGDFTGLRYDGFGRNVEKRRNVDVGDKSSLVQSAADFLNGINLVTDPKFEPLLKNITVAPFESTNYTSVRSTNGNSYTVKSVVAISGDGSNSKTITNRVYDCVGKVRKVWSTDGDGGRILQWFEYDTRGNKTLESLPVMIPPTIADDQVHDWLPTNPMSTVISYDSLDRLVNIVKPSHSGQSESVQTTVKYNKGGTEVIRTISSGTGAPTAFAIQEVTSQIVQRVGNQDQIVKIVDGAGAVSTFSYDPLGRLLATTDPGGRTETRTYNSRGKLMTMNNIYQNPQSSPGTFGMTRSYDVAGNVATQKNALGQMTSFVYDALGRVVSRTAYDGRSTAWTYDVNGFASLSSVVTSPSSSKNMESQFDYTYDLRNRLISSKLSLPDEPAPFVTTYTYDWHDQVLQQTLPDSTKVNYTYSGHLLSSTTMSHPPSEANWNFSATYSKYNFVQSPETVTLSGSVGLLANPVQISNNFDLLGFKVGQTVSSGSTPKVLVDAQYSYTGLDQLASEQEKITNFQRTYSYAARRLKSSTTQEVNSASHVLNYTYDMSGNLLTKGDLALSTGSSGITASQGGAQVVQVMYDGAGRMQHRKTSTSELTFTYDGFGLMSTISNDSTGSTTKVIHDHAGRTLVRTLPDGSREINAGGGLTVFRAPNSHVNQKVQRKLTGFGGHTVAVITTVGDDSSSSSVTASPSLNALITNLKGNVTSVIGNNGTIIQTVEYDDFGLITKSIPSDSVMVEGFEGKELDPVSQMLDFGARWYDPLLGRFATADNITGTRHLFGAQDASNRYAFECNDPINRIDPTGHWSWSFWVGLAVSVAAVGFAVLSGGLGVFAVGALMGAGMSGGMYSVSHRNETNAAKFWGGFLEAAAVGGVIGAATAGASSWMSGASTAGKSALATREASTLIQGAAREVEKTFAQRCLQAGGEALLNTIGGTVDKIGHNAMEDLVYDKHESLLHGINALSTLESFGKNLGLRGVSELWSSKVKPNIITPLTNSLKSAVGLRDAGEEALQWGDSSAFLRAVTSTGSKMSNLPAAGGAAASKWVVNRSNPFNLS